MDATCSGLVSWVEWQLFSTVNQSKVDITVSIVVWWPHYKYNVGVYIFDSQDPDNRSAYLFGQLGRVMVRFMPGPPLIPHPLGLYWNSEGRAATKSTALYRASRLMLLTDELNLTARLRYTEDDRASQSADSNSASGDTGSALGSIGSTDVWNTRSTRRLKDDDILITRLGVDYRSMTT